jgi:hypothetical protein
MRRFVCMFGSNDKRKIFTEGTLNNQMISKYVGLFQRRHTTCHYLGLKKIKCSNQSSAIIYGAIRNIHGQDVYSHVLRPTRPLILPGSINWYQAVSLNYLVQYYLTVQCGTHNHFQLTSLSD